MPIRKATKADIDQLITVCRRSFAHSIRWRFAPAFLPRRWWSAAIASRSAETWVSVDGDRPSGFCVLITDTDGWAEEEVKREYRSIVTLSKLAALARGGLNRVRRRAGDGNEHVEDRIRQETGNGGRRNDSTWVGLIAVSPGMRGRGLAKKMLRFCEERTRLLGADAMKLRVDTGNSAARCLYEGFGFECSREDSSGCIYTLKCREGTPMEGQERRAPAGQ